jgi:hypothetical protein
LAAGLVIITALASIIAAAIVSATIVSPAVVATIAPATTASATIIAVAATSAARPAVAIPFLRARLIVTFIRTSEQPQDPFRHALIFGRIVISLLAFLRTDLAALDNQARWHGKKQADDAGDNSLHAYSNPTPHCGPKPG